MAAKLESMSTFAINFYSLQGRIACFNMLVKATLWCQWLGIADLSVLALLSQYSELDLLFHKLFIISYTLIDCK